MTRARRRLLVVATWVSYLLAGGVAATFGKLAGMPLFLICTAGFCLLTRATRPYGLGMRKAESAHVDERMAGVRTAALARSNQVLSLLLLVAVAGWIPRAATQDQEQYQFWGALLIVSLLPNALVAWNEPDDPGENDREMTNLVRS